MLDWTIMLNDPKEEIYGEICIESVSGSVGLMAMVYSAFSLDPSDRKIIASNFQNVGRAITERLGLFSLSYPRVHERLPEVRAAVIDHVNS